MAFEGKTLRHGVLDQDTAIRILHESHNMSVPFPISSENCTFGHIEYHSRVSHKGINTHLKSQVTNISVQFADLPLTLPPTHILCSYHPFMLNLVILQSRHNQTCLHNDYNLLTEIFTSYKNYSDLRVLPGLEFISPTNLTQFLKISNMDSMANKTLLSWREAAEKCRRQNASLPVFTSRREAEAFIHAVLKRWSTTATPLVRKGISWCPECTIYQEVGVYVGLYKEVRRFLWPLIPSIKVHINLPDW